MIMQTTGAYVKQNLTAGWSRVDMLLLIYDRAIASLEASAEALEKGETSRYAEHMMRAQKAILAIQTGLEPEKNEVAFNIARLLHFVLTSIGKKDFEAAIKTLSDLREGFAVVAEEVNELERRGEIPPMPNASEYSSQA